MKNKLSKIRSITAFLAGISAASIPATVSAEWSIIGLGTLGGTSSTASSINDSGQVIGFSTTDDGYNHAFITGTNGVGMTDLGTLGGTSSTASSINDSGQVVGYSTTGVGNDHAFITGPNGVGITDLGTLGGTFSRASRINNSGQVVGSSTTGVGNDHHAFITGPNGVGMVDLGTLGGTLSIASSINDSGQAVGYSTVFGNSSELYSFIYSNGGMSNLSLLTTVVEGGWTHILASDINNNGQIVGAGYHDGRLEAFLLSFSPDTVFPFITTAPVPVPEPEAYAMMLAGFSLLGFLAHRRKESVA